MFDEDGWVSAKAAFIFGIVGLCISAVWFISDDYKLVKREPSVTWLQAPFTQEKNAQGQLLSNIILGFDEKGYVRWARQPLPQQTPAIPTQEKKDLTKNKS